MACRRFLTRTPCSRRSPTSGLLLTGRACRCARHAGTWPRALATQRHNEPFGTQPKQSSDGGAADHWADIACSAKQTASLYGLGPAARSRR